MRYLPLITLFILLGSIVATPGLAPGSTEFTAAQGPAEVGPSRGDSPRSLLPPARFLRYDGSRKAETLTLTEWKQIYFELSALPRAEREWPAAGDLWLRAGASIKGGIIPLACIDIGAASLLSPSLRGRAEPRQEFRLPGEEAELPATGRLLAAAALTDYTLAGAQVRFVLERELFFDDVAEAPAEIEINFADGRGFRRIAFDRPIDVVYEKPGEKHIRLRLTRADGSVGRARFPFHVRRLVTPAPYDTLSVTATIPYAGGFGTGEAYVYLAEGHTALTNPVVVVEGFDLYNNMNWNELYELLNQENLLETLRSAGYDAVVLNFDDATDYVQRSAYATINLIQQVQVLIDPDLSFTVVGPSLGGVAFRYALATMENQGLDHRVRTYISFDAPHSGANIPLGIQYWVDFFSTYSADAEFFKERLLTPAARQLLVYLFTDPPGPTGVSDPLRDILMDELAGLGEYPAQPRLVAVANGSGHGADQGFAPGEQILFYEHDTFLLDFIGNVWAAPDNSQHIIFQGLVDVLFPPVHDEMTVSVSGTRPYDSAPGGSRASMAQMDTTTAPAGDIIALHDSHCFIPTISALDLDTDDLFYDIAGDPELLEHTPFEVVYFPVANEEHVLISAQSAQWLMDEITAESTAAPGTPASPWTPVLMQNHPNPFNPVTSIRFNLPRAGHAVLRLYDTRGRLARTLEDGRREAGAHVVELDATGLASGLYFYELSVGDHRETRKLVILK